MQAALFWHLLTIYNYITLKPCNADWGNLLAHSIARY